MIGIVRGHAEELILYRHVANRVSRPGGTADGALELDLVTGECGSFARACKETAAEFLAGLGGVYFVRESCAGAGRIRRLGSSNPVEGDLLPESHVPQLLVNRVRRSFDLPA